MPKSKASKAKKTPNYNNPNFQTKAWTYTWIPITEDEFQRVCTAFARLHQRGGVVYAIAGKELAPSTGALHLQGYAYLSTKCTRAGFKKVVGCSSIHCEPSKGSAIQNQDYCSKDKQFFEWGDPHKVPKQGARRDLDEVRSRLDAGASVIDAVGDNFGLFLQYNRGLELYRTSQLGHRAWKTSIIWLWGPTGTGKSCRAHHEAYATANNAPVWSMADDNGQWFQGYNGQEYAIWDDFCGKAPIGLLLRLFDRYPYDVPFKGGSSHWRVRQLWITSNFSPEQLYGSCHQWPALQRRIEETRFIGEPFDFDLWTQAQGTSSTEEDRKEGEERIRQLPCIDLTGESDSPLPGSTPVLRRSSSTDGQRRSASTDRGRLRRGDGSVERTAGPQLKKPAVAEEDWDNGDFVDYLTDEDLNL